MDKVITLEKFAQKRPHWSAYDEKLMFYQKLAKDVAAQPVEKNVAFFHVNLIPLQAAIESEALSWIASIGRKILFGIFYLFI